ncbi:MAG: hypothetical protein U0Q55_00830 [Vicinamibacterales bacterium]
MPWSVTVDSSAGVVTTVYAGLLPPAVLRQAVAATLQACVEHSCVKLLADCSGLEGGHTVMDLYDAATELGATPGSSLLKEAVLVPLMPDAADTVAFWETAAVNRGIQVKLFTNRDDALVWLLAD